MLTIQWKRDVGETEFLSVKLRIKGFAEGAATRLKKSPLCAGGANPGKITDESSTGRRTTQTTETKAASDRSDDRNNKIVR